MDEKKVDIVCFHPCQGVVKVSGHSSSSPSVGLGDEEDFFSVFRKFGEVFANASFTSSTHVGIRGIPIGDSPPGRLLQQQRTHRRIQTAAKGKNGYPYPAFAKRPGGHRLLFF